MGPRQKEFKDYYRILSITEAASPAEIKKAYRKLALEHHPDHNRGDAQSEEKFKEITEAYGVLIDPKKKREYDLFRTDFMSGRWSGSSSSQFRYSQQDIFESMFTQGFGSEIFEELNREFSRSGFRSGNTFFQTIFFGGAVGKLGWLLGMIPGPIGKIGQGLRLVQMLGSSILTAKQMRQSQAKEAPGTEQAKHTTNPAFDSIKGYFSHKTRNEEAEKSLDLYFSITLPPAEALSGTQKKISYKRENETVDLLIQIPPKTPSGKKLRIKEKGYRKDGLTGDLILTVNVA